MLRGLRLRTINLLVSGVIVLAALGLALVLAYTIHNVRLIETSWLNYRADRSDKARLESIMRSAIGYGGMIHDFKNYIIRRQPALVERVQADITTARAAVKQYAALQLSEAEKVALDDINTMLTKYENALLTARSLLAQNTSSLLIDDRVTVDDAPAIRGLATLEDEVARQSGRKKESRKIKGRVAASLRAAMGYGGMIHEFKNLVLHSDLPRINVIQTRATEIENHIADYRKLGLSVAEKLALDDIAATIAIYTQNLRVAEKRIRAGDSLSDIDKAVWVDDTRALRGLTTLDREITRQVEIEAGAVGKKLAFLANIVPVFNWLILIAIGLAIILSIWLFRAYVIGPILTITHRMSRLAADDTDIEIPDMDLNNEIGQIERALETFRRNIISRRQAEQEIKQMAMTDPLTGLDNRKRFDEHLGEAISLSRRMNNKVACLMIDLDKFKPVNDEHGHAAGDAVLVTVGERMSQLARDTDFVARLGGDEFAMILTTLETAANAELPAKRLIDQLGLPIYFEGQEIGIGGSVGIAVFPDDADNAETLMRRADEALYAAKDAGRNTFRFANATQ